MLQTIRIIVRGKVQGVYFRQSTCEKARSLNITGTVENLPDKNVEIMATGSPNSLDQLVNWCRTGPPRALVTGVEVASLPTENFNGFIITR